MAKKRGGKSVVYSTDPDFIYDEGPGEQETLAPEEQKLWISLDRKQRKGKVVTLIEGFIGREADLKELERSLKQKCGTGGTSKDGIVLIQGDYCDLARELLSAQGYGVKLRR